jgi:predicted metal-dependent peptidase
MTKEEAQAIRDEIKEAMIQSAAAAGAGKTPAGIMRMIKDMTEPKISWRELVQQEIQSIIRNDYSFTRPNRKSMHSGAILPGMKEATTIDIGISIDMSGSIGMEDATVFLSEVKGIVDQYEDFKINLWCFDTEIYNHKEITHDNSQDLLDYEPQGGGGTMFEANWEFMKEEGIQPKKFIMFTDGYPCGSWGDPDYCDTIFIVKGNTEAESPFGQTVIYEKDIAGQ